MRSAKETTPRSKLSTTEADAAFADPIAYLRRFGIEAAIVGQMPTEPTELTAAA